jgi:predicted alpha/beta hydrolase family esterase
MAKVFIIHGSYGHPKENWLPWLKEMLEKSGHTVFIPEFSTPEGQSLEKWTEEFEDYLHQLDKDSIFVGHSLGPAFILSILEELSLPKPIKASFFVSGFIGLLGNPDFDEINKTFVNKSFKWQKIKQNCEKFYVFHSSNDPYVPLEKAKELAKNLGVEVILVENAGHFNEKAGYTKFELLLEKIKNVA